MSEAARVLLFCALVPVCFGVFSVVLLWPFLLIWSLDLRDGSFVLMFWLQISWMAFLNVLLIMAGVERAGPRAMERALAAMRERMN